LPPGEANCLETAFSREATPEQCFPLIDKKEALPEFP
jgi:hypothetical protein